MSAWGPKDSLNTYGINRWGAGYVDVNDEGHLLIRPNPEKTHQGVDLYKLAEHLSKEGLTLPVLVRFCGILRHRVDALLKVFDKATRTESFEGSYTAAYPIKVNQQHSVVETLSAHTSERVGLEVGSKPELLIAIATARKGAAIICNGYKDREFVQLALVAQQLGFEVFIVLDKYSELDLVLEESARMKVKPRLGLRVRLATIGAGNWQNTGGERSKFGLQAGEVLKVCQRLESEGRCESLVMLHFHLGSQIPNLKDVETGVKEACQYFVQLRKKGMAISQINVGGGLGVDYEGTASRSFCSMDYGLQDYANTVVRNIVEACKAHNLPHPDIFTESGRAMTAHHAVLLTQVIDVERVKECSKADAAHTELPIIRKLREMLENIDQSSAVECYEQAGQRIAELETLYSGGSLSLEQRAEAESLYVSLCKSIKSHLSASPDTGNRSHQKLLDELNEKLADKLFCNFSLFQSIPDHWAIEQVFPIVPLAGLEKKPERRGIVHDITCDSDGRIGLYVDKDGVETSLPIHDINPSERYYLGIFLVGAYQEILGDMHNLFGDTHSVNVEVDKDGFCRLSQSIRGDTVEEALNYVHFDAKVLQQRFSELVSSNTDLTKKQGAAFLSLLEEGLKGYTYYEH